MKEFGIRLQPRQKSDLIEMCFRISGYPGRDITMQD
jgi:hypothetical protein